MVRFTRFSPAEKHGLELLLAKNPAKFPEPKERNQTAEYNKTAAEQVIDAYLAEDSCHGFSTHKAFNHFLDKMEDQNKQAKYKPTFPF